MNQTNDDQDLNQSPAVSDSQSQAGHNPDLESDDDIDQVGEEFGVEYQDDEELDISRKVHLNTTSQPPKDEDPSA